MSDPERKERKIRGKCGRERERGTEALGDPEKKKKSDIDTERHRETKEIPRDPKDTLSETSESSVSVSVQIK